MVRTVTRSYVLKASDVHEAILMWLKSKDTPIPEYIGNTPTCSWDWGDKTIVIQWTEELKD